MPLVLQFSTSFMPAKTTTSHWRAEEPTPNNDKKLNPNQPKKPKTPKLTLSVEINCNKLKVVSGTIPACNNFYVFTITTFFESCRPHITEKYIHGETAEETQNSLHEVLLKRSIEMENLL